MKSIAIVLLAIGLAPAARATTVIPMSVEELTQAASSVLEVDVLNSWSSWNADHSLIYTYSRVRVRQALKGGVEPEVVVQQLGGSSQGYTMKVAGVHALEKGERAVLFLRPERANGGATWTIVGLMQGHFRLYSRAGRMLAGNGLQVPAARAEARHPVSLPGSTAPANAAGAASAATASSTAAGFQAQREFASPSAMTVQELESRVRRALKP